MRFDAVLGEVFGHLVHGLLHAAEDHGQGRFLVLQQVVDQALLVPGFHGQPALVDGRHREALLGGDDLLRVPHVAAGQLLDVGADGGADEDRLRVLLHRAQDLADVVPEADVEHAVDLVQDGQLDPVVGQHAAGVHVHDAAGGADDDGRAALEALGLGLDGLAAVDRERLEAGVAAELLDLAADLDGQLAGGDQDEGGELVLGGEQAEGGQAEGGRLAGAGLGLAEHVLAAHGDRDECRLDLGGVLEAGGLNALEDRLGEAEVGEGLGGVERLAADHSVGAFLFGVRTGLGPVIGGGFYGRFPRKPIVTGGRHGCRPHDRQQHHLPRFRCR